MSETTREIRIFGPPGTGKTTYMARQVTLAAEKYGERIMVASFTRTAAAELTGRDLPIPQEQIGTLHAHCYRALGYPKIAETQVKKWNEYMPRFALTSGSGDVDEGAVDQVFATPGDEAMNEYQVLRAKMRPRESWPVRVQQFAAAWEDWKKQTYAIDFTDMIEHALTDITFAPGMPEIGFFDECQDFTLLELSLVRKWGKNMHSILLSGDDDQCLYSFKGSTPDAFLDPPIPQESKRVLNQSYRVPRKVQALAQRWVETLTRREPKIYQPRDEDGELRVLQAANFRRPEIALTDAQQYLDAGKKVMFLTTCSYMLDPLKKILRKEGMPYHNPYRRKRGDWNPLHGGGGGVPSFRRLLSYLRLQPDVWGEYANWWTGRELAEWANCLKQKGVFLPRGKSLIEQWTTTSQIDRPLELNMLLDILEESALTAAMNGDLEWFTDNLLAARKKGLEYPLQIARQRGAAVMRKEPQIIIGTIHSVKGGEADAVYLFPDLSVAGMREWLSGREYKDAIIRQFYVGLTRARESLILCGPATPYHVVLNAV